MPGLRSGIVVKIVDKYAIDVLVDGAEKIQQFAAILWEPEEEI